jgi:hypothetical protein
MTLVFPFTSDIPTEALAIASEMDRSGAPSSMPGKI